MELIQYQQLIIQGMFHLNEISPIDCIWLSPEYQLVHGFISHPIPRYLSFDSPSELNSINELCFSKQQPRFCLVATSMTLEFLFIPLVYNTIFQGFVRIGPYLTNPLTEQNFSNLMHTSNIPLKEHLSLRSYYDSLPLISNETDIHLGHIGMNVFGHTIVLTTFCHYSEKTQTRPLPSKSRLHEEDIHEIELRYAYEHKLRQAIATSDHLLLDEVTAYFSRGSFVPDRFPDNPLRSAKNLAIVLNTILRHAAEEGGLHPYFLDQISKKYALLIEQSTTRTGIHQLQDEMYEAYFQEVKHNAYKTTSPFINRIIAYIILHLEEDLSLTSLANKFHVKPSNLANQFKKETEITVSEFVNTRRIELACHYLKNSHLSIHAIGLLVGFQDANYFTRVFKKIKGVSPSTTQGINSPISIHDE